MAQHIEYSRTFPPRHNSMHWQKVAWASPLSIVGGSTTGPSSTVCLSPSQKHASCALVCRSCRTLGVLQLEVWRQP